MCSEIRIVVLLSACVAAISSQLENSDPPALDPFFYSKLLKPKKGGIRKQSRSVENRKAERIGSAAFPKLKNIPITLHDENVTAPSLFSTATLQHREYPERADSIAQARFASFPRTFYSKSMFIYVPRFTCGYLTFNRTMSAPCRTSLSCSWNLPLQPSPTS